MTLSLALICDARADGEIASALAERVIRAHAHWIEETNVSDYLCWRGLSSAESFLCWTNVSDLAAEHGIRAHGFFAGEVGKPEAVLARKALALLDQVGERPLDGIVLIRDSENKPERWDGFEQARSTVKLPLPVIIGVAHSKRECWVLVGYVPADDAECERLKELREELSFDPCLEPTRLNDRGEGEPRSAKRVLRHLTEGNREREAACWLSTALEVLRERGEDCGLTAYLIEVEQLLVPLFTR
jgi:hypothetical protein